jgi:hypothetical protein
MELIMISKMCLAETYLYSDVLEGIHLPDEFPVQNCMKQ